MSRRNQVQQRYEGHYHRPQRDHDPTSQSTTGSSRSEGPDHQGDPLNHDLQQSSLRSQDHQQQEATVRLLHQQQGLRDHQLVRQSMQPTTSITVKSSTATTISKHQVETATGDSITRRLTPTCSQTTGRSCQPSPRTLRPTPPGSNPSRAAMICRSSTYVSYSTRTNTTTINVTNQSNINLSIISNPPSTFTLSDPNNTSSDEVQVAVRHPHQQDVIDAAKITKDVHTTSVIKVITPSTSRSHLLVHQVTTIVTRKITTAASTINNREHVTIYHNSRDP
ncbi:hypothetical protein BDK51DRAFT_48111 [Blyttiomyces helicus]|uniref:Uncharacterized protein n=1 Tax=Blyttiomyces helicus TaxID=388810 RepID=A0A4V1IRS4_9FUNG|nr:hypothetical protein BDK51DRAFT_48111 [Blyttiomyces helicus]|eukprot:RKO91067.1 hypothetical protein BDK51DRAFT_48111 [Blyttiomyces helicus]